MDFVKLRPKYVFNFLVRVTGGGSSGLFVPSKVAPVLNQLAIEDGPSVDNLLADYCRALGAVKGKFSFFMRATLIVWNRQAPASLLFIKCFTSDSLLKFWLEEKNRAIFKYSFNTNSGRPKKLYFYFTLAFLSSLFWSPERGFRGSVHAGAMMAQNLRGSLPTYSKRHLMLGRKINFRRKVKKKGFLDY